VDETLRAGVILPRPASKGRLEEGGVIATCVRCDNEFELVAEWHDTIAEEATGESVTLVYRSVVCDDCLSESEVELRQKWETGNPVDPGLMGVDPRPERRLTEG
jgi:hypothetical protein